MLGSISNQLVNNEFKQMELVYNPTLGSLRELYENAEQKISNQGTVIYPQRTILQEQLKHLLKWEAESGYSSQLLKEYREVFDFDTDYSLYLTWEIVPASYSQELKTGSTLEEIQEEMRQGNCRLNEYEMPDFDSKEVQYSIEFGYEFTGEWKYEPSIWIKNFRLKKVAAEV